MGRKVSFLDSAEERVGKGHDGPSLDEARAEAGGTLPPETGLPGIPSHYRPDPEYQARQRAEELLNMDVVRSQSPAGRYQLDPAAEAASSYRYRWCSPEYREKRPGGMDIWDPVTDPNEAKRMCPHSGLKRGEDGKFYMGTVFLAKATKVAAEERTALYFQRSQRMLKEAQQGSARPQGPSGEALPQPGPGLETLRRQTETPEDPGVTSEVSLTKVTPRNL